MQLQLEPGTLNPRSFLVPLPFRSLECRRKNARPPIIESTFALRQAQRSAFHPSEQILWLVLGMSSAALVLVSFLS